MMQIFPDMGVKKFKDFWRRVHKANMELSRQGVIICSFGCVGGVMHHELGPEDLGALEPEGEGSMQFLPDTKNCRRLYGPDA